MLGFMRKLSALLSFVVAPLAFADDLTYSSDMYDSGGVFVGMELGGAGIADFSAGIIGGYAYYFTQSYQNIDSFRQGIRGIVGINWGLYKHNRFDMQNGSSSETSSNSFYTRVGVDWIIDFNPQDTFVWGAFAGLNIGHFKVFTSDSIPLTHRGFNLEGHIGGSLTYKQIHKLELLFGWGYSRSALRYVYMF
ncbi:hypothetical protein OQH61_04530 [Helicobacter sp. MIT 21-1697]|uniref:hypothetical protein n=1 Tax=Helicobacter sp. MIT 21-1697 TaxID=2993733 RepID=UPI00224B67EB|nr:hypothetical protein [Helicobacter sp. MIT 21-1697]MCX2716999.1 hypothetical protein [Helicobacter sp. MIT 21-1697]